LEDQNRRPSAQRQSTYDLMTSQQNDMLELIGAPASCINAFCNLC